MKTKPEGRILVLGAGGLMGRYLVDHGMSAGIDVRGFNRQQLDITDEAALRRVIDSEKPHWIVNAAACARMEKCAEDPGKTRILNTKSPEFLAELARVKGIRFCHVSSDYVFDGKAREPYDDDAVPSPLSEYARQKAAADAAVQRYPEHLILRVAWLFGKGGETFMSKMPGLLQDQPVLKVASGRKGNCLYMGIGAGWILELIGREASGIFNFVHPGETTWEQFARKTLQEMQKLGLNPKCEKIEAVPMSAMAALQEPRPEYTVLAVDKLERALGRKLEDWPEGIEKYLAEMTRSSLSN